MMFSPQRFASVLAVGLALMASACGPSTDDTNAGVPIGGAFSLIDQDGAPVTDADFAGRPMIIYFGFTYCPDVCPLALNKLAIALEIVGDGADTFQPILITIDPERDTPEQLALYVASYGFPDGLMGLTGPLEDIQAVADAYRVHFKKIDSPDTAADYLMEHTSVLYLMDENGQFADAFTHASTPQEIADRLQRYLDAHG